MHQWTLESPHQGPRLSRGSRLCVAPPHPLSASPWFSSPPLPYSLNNSFTNVLSHPLTPTQTLTNSLSQSPIPFTHWLTQKYSWRIAQTLPQLRRFLTACLSRPRFNTPNLVEKIRRQWLRGCVKKRLGWAAAREEAPYLLDSMQWLKRNSIYIFCFPTVWAAMSRAY